MVSPTLTLRLVVLSEVDQSIDEVRAILSLATNGSDEVSILCRIKGKRIDLREVRIGQGHTLLDSLSHLIKQGIWHTLIH